ncbi:Putative uncharacterized protein FLJ37770 [Eumeta japonica]|uniref:Mariner Mos1 transposase n=1 Tax=Eumeta variegata TaxID=151549 RepID=A0A4C1Z7W5_EUMVA|nr:Putative uncharacterized protein FLJ37770 [Eumeta japonica]
MSFNHTIDIYPPSSDVVHPESDLPPSAGAGGQPNPLGNELSFSGRAFSEAQESGIAPLWKFMPHVLLRRRRPGGRRLVLLRLGLHDEAPFLATVYNWFNKVQRGRTDLTDDLREGRPSKATTGDNISVLRLMIKTNIRVTYKQIRTNLGIGMSQMHKILHEHLTVRKLCTRWIPNNFTDAQKLRYINRCCEMMQRFACSNAVYDLVTGEESWIFCYHPEIKRRSVQWVFSFEELPTKVRRGRSVGGRKKMVAFSFGMRGLYETIVLEYKKKAVNADWYSVNCLPFVLQKVRGKRSRSRIHLHHEHASLHTATV